MALIKCKECGNPISKKASICPNCGAPARKKTSLSTWLVTIFIVLPLFIGYLSNLNNSGSTDKSSNTNNSYSSKQAVIKKTILKQPKLIPYNILKRESRPPYKITFEVEVPLVDGRLPSTSEIGAISTYLVSTEAKYDKSFVTFLLPGMVHGSGAYATAHHNPTMDVKVQDFTLARYPQYSKLQKAESAQATEQYHPTKFQSVDEMFESFNDYYAANKTFKILSSTPLHIQLSPSIVQGDVSKVIEAEVGRALVYGVYRTFIHTDINEITVTAIPLEINFKTNDSRYVTKYKRTMSHTRAKALALVKKHLQINTLSDLVTGAKIEGKTFADQWIGEFDRLYYNDRAPGLNRFIGELALASHPTANNTAPSSAKIEQPKTKLAPFQGNDIAKAQHYLTLLDFDPGPVDGLMGQKTRQAIRDFQNSWGLSVDGKVSPQLIQELEQIVQR